MPQRTRLWHRPSTAGKGGVPQIPGPYGSGIDPGGVELGRPTDYEVTPGSDLGAHEQVEHGAGGGAVFDPHPAQHAVTRIHGGLSELAGVHLAQALVPLHRLLPALAL